MGLLAVLGVLFGLSVTVGNTIGSGILRTPGLVAGLLPTPWLFIGVWIIGALRHAREFGRDEPLVVGGRLMKSARSSWKWCVPTSRRSE